MPVRDSWLAISALVSEDDLSVVFQPIVDLDSGESFAYEALVRCAVPNIQALPFCLNEQHLSDVLDDSVE